MCLEFCKMFIYQICILLTLLGVCHASPLAYKGFNAKESQVLDTILRNLLNPWQQDSTPSADPNHWGSQWKPLEKNMAVNGFSWKNCGGSGDWGKVNSLTIQPDPLPIPGNVSVSFSGSLSHDATSPIQLSLKIKKKELFWIPVPCIDDLGSCDYDDICKLVSSITCPPVFKKYNIPCKCPFKAGSYKLPPSEIEVNPFGIPSWLEGGDYQVTAALKDKGQQIFCIFVQFSLTK